MVRLYHEGVPRLDLERNRANVGWLRGQGIFSDADCEAELRRLDDLSAIPPDKGGAILH